MLSPLILKLNRGVPLISLTIRISVFHPCTRPRLPFPVILFENVSLFSHNFLTITSPSPYHPHNLLHLQTFSTHHRIPALQPLIIELKTNQSSKSLQLASTTTIIIIINTPTPSRGALRKGNPEIFFPIHFPRAPSVPASSALPSPTRSSPRPAQPPPLGHARSAFPWLHRKPGATRGSEKNIKGNVRIRAFIFRRRLARDSPGERGGGGGGSRSHVCARPGGKNRARMATRGTRDGGGDGVWMFVSERECREFVLEDTRRGCARGMSSKTSLSPFFSPASSSLELKSKRTTILAWRRNLFLFFPATRRVCVNS